MAKRKSSKRRRPFTVNLSGFTLTDSASAEPIHLSKMKVNSIAVTGLWDDDDLDKVILGPADFTITNPAKGEFTLTDSGMEKMPVWLRATVRPKK